jgi:hypothetical protein
MSFLLDKCNRFAILAKVSVSSSIGGGRDLFGKSP